MPSRRSWLKLAALEAFGLGLLGPTGSNAVRAAQGASLSPLNRFPRMVQEYFVQRVAAAQLAGIKEQQALKTRADAETYVRRVRESIQRCFGLFPEKTPLNPRVTGVIERDAYRIEKVIFESRPGFLVTANLYVPKGKKLPAPGVVVPCGHSDIAKAYPAYQSVVQALARMGYVALIFDPIGQGERLQYAHLGGSRTRPKVGVEEHLYAGNQQFLVGDFFGSWRAWDGIRALDYLLTRPEVDPNQVAVTGNSGGGTMTTWLAGLDARWSMAAPQCFVTTFRRNLENELPADTEQCPPRALALHLDHCDFLAALAPKPVLILAQEKDFFDPRGSEEGYRRLRSLYRLLGAEENVKLFMGPLGHGYSQESREAMYQFFNRFTHVSDAKSEPLLAIEEERTLWCTPTGQVGDMKSRTVFSFTREKARTLAAKRGRPEVSALREMVKASLKLPERTGVSDFRILRLVSGRKYPRASASLYAVETEPGIQALVYRLSDERLASRPPRDQGRAILYIAHHSCDVELRDEPLIAELMKNEPGATLYACDVRGTGESQPDTCGSNQFLRPYGSDFFYAIHSIMLDHPYVGQKTFDVLRVLDWLASFGHKEVHLAARGWGTFPATFAALLADPLVKQVTLKNALTSYEALAQSEMYDWPLSSFVPGALEKFDLPDCYRALEARKLRMVDPRGPASS